MQRRHFVQLGLLSAALVAAAGGSLALLQPDRNAGQLAPAGRDVLAATAAALLEGALPTADGERQAALAGLLQRADKLIAALPPHTQSELSQLFALLHNALGRRALAGLGPPWERASVAELQQALGAMRHSRLHLRRQVYQGLHELVTGAWLMAPDSWRHLGYPGPPRLAP